MAKLTDSEKERALELAHALGTHVPGWISIVAWPLPIIEELANRVIALEAEVKVLQEKQ